jgi:hypothetical protein
MEEPATLERTPDLDADHDEDAPLRFRALADLLGSSEPPGLAECNVVARLLMAIGNEPAIVEEAKEAPEWRVAMLEEMVSIEENRTWMLIDLPEGHRAIGLKGSSR